MTTTQYILAIDLGTSGPKVALFDTNGKVLGSVTEETQLLLDDNGLAEQDPSDWWQAIVSATQQLLSQNLIPVEHIVGLACTAQWSGTVAIDAAGQPLMNAMTWMDSRGATAIKNLFGKPPTVAGYNIAKLPRWLKITGGMPSLTGKDSLAHILWLKQHRPEIYAATDKFLEPKDYLNYKLTGKIAATVESATLHWVTDNRDINNIHYHNGLLNAVGLPREKLPDLHQSTDILGPLQPDIAAELGLSDQVQVVASSPDVHAAAVGSGAVNDFEAHLYIGTSSWLICHIPFKKTDVIGNIASLPSAIPGRYLAANEQETAGECLRFLQRQLFFPDDPLSTGPAPDDFFARLNATAALAPAGSNQLLFTPWLFGERTPLDDHTIRGGWHNLSLQHTRADMIRSVLEGVAFNSRLLLQTVERFCGQELTHINFIGGGANSALWSQIYADVLNRPIRQVKNPVEANARGAAWLAAVGLGYQTFQNISTTVEISATYTPNPENREVYDKLFAAFHSFYKQTKRWHAQLNTSATH